MAFLLLQGFLFILWNRSRGKCTRDRFSMQTRRTIFCFCRDTYLTYRELLFCMWPATTLIEVISIGKYDLIETSLFFSLFKTIPWSWKSMGFIQKNCEFLLIFVGRDVTKTPQADTTEPASVVNTTCSFVAPAFIVLSLLVSFLQSRDKRAASICKEHPTICKISCFPRAAHLCIHNTLALAGKPCWKFPSPTQLAAAAASPAADPAPAPWCWPACMGETVLTLTLLSKPTHPAYSKFNTLTAYVLTSTCWRTCTNLKLSNNTAKYIVR